MEFKRDPRFGRMIPAMVTPFNADLELDLDRAQELAEQVKTLYPDTEIYIAPIGPIIGSHTGPGMLALIFWGTER